MFLHLGCLLFVPFCVVATWWQITRAQDGNGLSYLYTFEWPVFAIVGIYFWWQFLHTDYDAVGLKGMRNQAVGSPISDAETDSANKVVEPATPPPTISSAIPPMPAPAPMPLQDEDPELAAYNARLAALSTSGGKTWRKPEAPIARRPQ